MLVSWLPGLWGLASLESLAPSHAHFWGQPDLGELSLELGHLWPVLSQAPPHFLAAGVLLRHQNLVGFSPGVLAWGASGCCSKV